MKFKRLLTVGLMALLCAGTATAASQLNSMQVMPKANTATVNLRTTGSFTHKEYRPDEHLLLIDLAGVTADAAVQRTATLSSAVLKSYKLSSYTSASGGDVTRIQLELGEQVTADVNDVSGGLQVLLSGGGPATADSSAAVSTDASSPAPAPAESAAPAAKPAPAETSISPQPVPQKAAPAVKDAGTQQSAPVVVAATSAERTPQPPVGPIAAVSSLAPTTIRNVRVQRGQGTLDVIIEGPSSARPFLLKNPDRLVLDFNNAVLRSSVRNIPVHGRDVLQVRVGRFHAEPPMTRIVIDLNGPRGFDVVSAAEQVTVHVKSEQAETLSTPLKPAPAPALASAPSPSPNTALASALALAPAPARALASAPTAIPAPMSAPVPAAAPASISTRVPAPVPTAAPTPALASVPTPAPAVVPAPAPMSAPVPTAAPTPALASVPTPAPAVVPAPAPMSAPVPTAAPTPALASVPVPAPAVAPAPIPTPAPTAASISTPMPAPVPVATPVPAAAPAPAVAPVPASAPAAVPAPTPAEAPKVAARPRIRATTLQTSDGANTAQPSASPAKYVAGSLSNSNSQLRDQPTVDPNVRASVAAGTMAGSPQADKPAVEIARLNAALPDQFSGSSAAAAPSATKYTGEPISVNLKDVDLKDFFRLIHEISGLNIVLDPSVKGSCDPGARRRALGSGPGHRVEEQCAGSRVAGKSASHRGHRHPAAEAIDRRAQSEAVALAVDRQTITRFLSYAKARNVVPIIKKFLTARGEVISDERTNALIISDIPSVLPNLDSLITTVGPKEPGGRNRGAGRFGNTKFTRDLGFQLGFNWGNGVSTIGGSNPQSDATSILNHDHGSPSATYLFSPTFRQPNPTTGFSIQQHHQASYGIDAILTAAETHNLAKVLSRPRVVTQSNVKAEVKQGVKIPVYTAGTANANASVSYVDAVLRLSVTPQITADNTIFLTVDVENTQPERQASTATTSSRRSRRPPRCWSPMAARS